jgi:hypothetical protein
VGEVFRRAEGSPSRISADSAISSVRSSTGEGEEVAARAEEAFGTGRISIPLSRSPSRLRPEEEGSPSPSR